MNCEVKPWGRLKTGEEVKGYYLSKDDNICATILDYGCIIQSLKVRDKKGEWVDVVLGYDTIGEYEEHDGYFGAAIGRVGNRIEKGEFELNGVKYNLAQNNGGNHLHGGTKGYDAHIWNGAVEEDCICFHRISEDGEEQYPGTLDATVTYRFTEEKGLNIQYKAKSDQDTIVNMTNHSYFNLNGSGSVLNQELKIKANRFCENNENSIPTGNLLDVEGTPFDFREYKEIGRDIEKEHIQLKNGNGYDHNYCLEDNQNMDVVITMVSNETGIVMEVKTSLPGVQFYSSNFVTHRAGKNGMTIDRRDSICLETQGYPNAINNPKFPSIVLKKDEIYFEETTYQFSIKQ